MLSPKRLLGALVRRRALLQQTLAYRVARKLQLNDVAVFQSFDGRTVGDSPYELMMELGRRIEEPAGAGRFSQGGLRFCRLGVGVG